MMRLVNNTLLFLLAALLAASPLCPPASNPSATPVTPAAAVTITASPAPISAPTTLGATSPAAISAPITLGATSPAPISAPTTLGATSDAAIILTPSADTPVPFVTDATYTAPPSPAARAELATLATLVCAPALAPADDPAREGVEGLLEEFSLILPSGMEGLADGAGSALGVDSLLSGLVTALGGGIPDAVLFFLLAFCSAVAIGLASLCPAELAPAVRGGVTVVAGGVLLLYVLPLAADLSAALSSLGSLFSGVSALLASAAALAGGGSIAASSAAGVSLTLSLFGGLCGVLLPLCAVMLVLGVTSSIGGAGSPLLGTVRGWFTRGVGIVTALIGGLFAIQTAVSAAGDSSTLRAIKYAASGSIPVVGGAVSGALSTLAGGVGYAAHIIGGGGVAAMLTVALAPLVRLLLYRLALAAARLVADSLPDGGSACLSALASALDSLIAVYSLGAVIYVFEAVVLLVGITSLL